MNYKEILDKIENSLVGKAHLDELAKKNQNPFKILISTILSARTKDSNTQEATLKLFSKYKTPVEIANADIEDLEKLIYKAGFYKVKASRIKKVSKMIIDEYQGIIPNDFEKLIRLPGVGAKTANCVLIYAFNIDAIAVDTHVHRISNRLKWVKTKKPEETEKALKEEIPKTEWKRINRIFVKFGQQICLPTNPKHHICPIEDICPKDFSTEKPSKKLKKKRK